MVSVLVVDDNEAFAGLLARGLSEAGYKVATAANARDALALIKAQPFDAVVTDIIMPGSDGFELIDQVKRLQRVPRIIAMSGGGTLYDADACLQAAEHSGVDAVLEKPFNAQDLARCLNKLSG